ncbi:MAG TPA: T9SS type A sorting domain-containing protein, partial [Lutibacter sp.]|nr:T9SS type A sorting domain-containing protein [Lutibacter sp.]
ELESIGVTELNNKLQISVFPNPTTGALSINSQINNLKTDIIITNLLGEKCYKNKISIHKSTSIDISFLPKGIYLLSIVNKQQERILTKKIIKL